MRRFLLFAVLLIAAVPAAQSATIDLNAQREAARQRREAAARNRAANSGGAAGQTAATPPFCWPATSGAPGPISLLGVTSQMGPSARADQSPVGKLTSEHPAKQALANIGTEMGIYGDPEGASDEQIARNNAFRKRKSLHDFYEEVLGLANWGRSGADRLLELPDESGYFAAAAQAHREYQELARRYASLLVDAENAGRACP